MVVGVIYMGHDFITLNINCIRYSMNKFIATKINEQKNKLSKISVFNFCWLK